MGRIAVIRSMGRSTARRFPPRLFLSRPVPTDGARRCEPGRQQVGPGAVHRTHRNTPEVASGCRVATFRLAARSFAAPPRDRGSGPTSRPDPFHFIPPLLGPSVRGVNRVAFPAARSGDRDDRDASGRGGWGAGEGKPRRVAVYEMGMLPNGNARCGSFRQIGRAAMRGEGCGSWGSPCRAFVRPHTLSRRERKSLPD